jgi:N-acetylglucosaminyl-diphospho-decaprenol L-rhamnosyltransferase
MSTAVLIVNYKSYDELGRCLRSLTPYRQSDDEVVVVDYESDASALAAAVGGQAGVQIVVRSDNLGFAAGINLAASHARAKYLMWLNPDATLEGPVIRLLEDWLTSHPDVGAAGPRVLNADGSTQATARRFPDVTTAFGGRSTWLTRRFPSNWLSKHNLGAREAQSPIDVDWVSGVCLTTPRELFNRLGGLDEGFFMYWEDADYGYRVREAGLRRMYVPGAAIRHPGGRSAAQNSARAIRAFHESAFRLYRKHASLLGQVVSPLVGVALWLRSRWQLRP